MRARTVALAACLVLVAPLVSGVAAAQGTLDHLTDPASQAGRDIKALFDLIWPISVVVGVLVEAVLIYAIIRFRATKKGPVVDSGERERGHHKMEIAWTIPPVVILLMVGLLSTQTLFAIENPGDPDFTVKVTGFQFGWTFEYPDGAIGADELVVEVDQLVGLEIHATDVIHSFAVPAVGVKIDAIPGRVNHYSFEADREGTYLVQCMEYCGRGHNEMRGRVVVLPAGSTEDGYRSPGAGAQVNLTDADIVVDMSLLESGGPGGAQPWSIEPPTYTYEDPTQVLGVRVINPAGQSAPHNLTIVKVEGGQEQKVAAYDPLLQAGQEGAFLATLERGDYIYYCAVPGHRSLGMEGSLTVT